ncbi:hypothetical protein DFS34DRAFT_591845 [Phlyctochytrium arcticum]|nr:hypothetical protein DFS34DRAFT_591845 [Phlyctochytrium arcticum]
MDELLAKCKQSETYSLERVRSDLLPALQAASSLAPNDLRTILDNLDPARHTLPFLNLLLQVSHASDTLDAWFWKTTLRFATEFSMPRTYYVSTALVSFASTLVRYTERSPLQRNGTIKILQIICARWGNRDKAYFTPIHTLLLRCHLKAKTYGLAETFLQQEMYEYDVDQYPLKYQDFLLFQYYGALVYIALKKWEKAKECLLLCITAPGTTTSAIQVEAYRKYILCCLLRNGKLESTSTKGTYVEPGRIHRSLLTPYLDFAQAYEILHGARIDHELKKSEPAFAKHGNIGLIKQCRTQVILRKIQRLTETHLTLSITDIAKSSQMPKTNIVETLVRKMISNGSVFATIAQEQGHMVSFCDPPNSHRDLATCQGLTTALDNVHAYESQIAKLNRSISSSREYLHKTLQADRGLSTAGGAAGAFVAISEDGRTDDDAETWLERKQSA